MIISKLGGVYVSLVLAATAYTDAFADRLIRRSDAQLVSIGRGNLDEEKETVLFRGCVDNEAKIYKLKEYAYQVGNDCDGPPIFTVLESLKVEGAVKTAPGEGCTIDQNCMRYIVKSAQDAERIFKHAQKGDFIDVVVTKGKSDRATKTMRAIDLIVQLKAKGSGITETVTFKNVSATDSVIKKVGMEK